jgi:hypothetical protein
MSTTARNSLLHFHGRWREISLAGRSDDFINKAVRCTNPYNSIMENSSLLSRSNPFLCELQCNHKTGNIVYVITSHSHVRKVIVPIRHMAERSTW